MYDLIRITCPPSELPRAKRIEHIYNDFEKWIRSEAMNRLVRLYNSEVQPPSYLPFKDYVCWLKDFASKHWDYRKMQKDAMTKEGEAARWLLQNDTFAEENKDKIYGAATTLGLIGVSTPIINNPDYILPLGGARMSNLRRAELARQTVDKYNLKTKIVALSTYRPIAETERSSIDSYASGAQYEFDAIVSGMDSAFEMKGAYSIKNRVFDNPNKNYGICTFNSEYNGTKLYALAAPSTFPDVRRANSADCFEFLFKEFDIQEGSYLINCTSQIYCTYQHVRALSLAIKHKVVFDTIGFPFYLNEIKASNESSLSKPVNYLQEIKGTIDAIYDFILEF